MDKYPKLIFTCEGDGIYVLGPGPNPMAEIRRLDTGEAIGNGPQQLMSIVAHIDLNEWNDVPDVPEAGSDRPGGAREMKEEV